MKQLPSKMVDISKINTIAVIGAGTMGREIAQVCLMGGFNLVYLYDNNRKIIENAVLFINNGLKKIEAKKVLSNSFVAKELINHLKIAEDLKEAVQSADFIIEAIPEVMTLKQELFQKIGNIAPEHAIIATNTSTMNITEIASTSGREEKVIGMHFFTPIPLLRLIEIIKGEKTSDSTVNITVSVGNKLPALKGKRFLPIINKESPGFIVNRLTIASNLYINWLLDYAFENDIPFEQVDADVGELQNLGPFSKLDYLGLDVVANAMLYFKEVVSPEFAPGKTLQKYVKKGKLGRKTGEGLFKWKEGKPILDKSNKAGIFNPELFMAIQLNEGCRLLEEGSVSNYKDIDQTMLAGMDMPGPFTPGKRNYVKWTKLLEDFVRESGIQYLSPCELMKSGEFLKMR